MFYRRGHGGKQDLHLPTKHIVERGPAAAIRHVCHIDAGHQLRHIRDFPVISMALGLHCQTVVARGADSA
jgi:hypothetical protein